MRNNIYYTVPQKLIDEYTLNSSDLLIAAIISSFCKLRNNECSASVKTISKEVDLSLASTYNSIKKLLKFRVLFIKRTQKWGKRIFCVNPKAFELRKGDFYAKIYREQLLQKDYTITPTNKNGLKTYKKYSNSLKLTQGFITSIYEVSTTDSYHKNWQQLGKLLKISRATVYRHIQILSINVKSLVVGFYNSIKNTKVSIWDKIKPVVFNKENVVQRIKNNLNKKQIIKIFKDIISKEDFEYHEKACQKVLDILLGKNTNFTLTDLKHWEQQLYFQVKHLQNKQYQVKQVLKLA